jgi:HicB-like protein involved in pilus formation
MSANKTTDAIKLNLRLPKSLHRRLTREAKENSVSLNTEIIHQLEGHDVKAFLRSMEKMEQKLLSTLSRMRNLQPKLQRALEAAADQLKQEPPPKGKPKPDEGEK